MPAVIATTGHTDEEKAIISRASHHIPVFYSRNMSLGINLLMELARQTAKMLGPEFDIEIVEKHQQSKAGCTERNRIDVGRRSFRGNLFQARIRL